MRVRELAPAIGAATALTLIGDAGGFGYVLAGNEQKFVPRSGDAFFAVGPVLFAFVKLQGFLFGRPLENQKKRQDFSLPFDSFNIRRASQITPATPLDHLGNILYVFAGLAMVGYLDFHHGVVFHGDSFGAEQARRCSCKASADPSAVKELLADSLAFSRFGNPPARRRR